MTHAHCQIRPFLALIIALAYSGALQGTETIGDGWRINEVGSGNRPSLERAADGRLHVMASRQADDEVEIWHASASDPAGPWEPGVVTRGLFYTPGDVVVALDGTVHLLYHNHVTEDAEHVIVGEPPTVIRVETPGTHNGWDNSAAMDGAGRLHQAAVHPLDVGGKDSLEYGVWEGGAWSYGAMPFEDVFLGGLGVSLALDEREAPVIAYCVSESWEGPGELRLASRTDGVWRWRMLVEGAGRGRFPSLAVDTGGGVHLAWLDVDPEDGARATVRYGHVEGNSFREEPVDVLDGVVLGLVDARRAVSLRLGPDNTPRISYGDTLEVRLATHGETGWTRELVARSDVSLYNGLTALELAESISPIIVFWQEPDADGGGRVRIASRAPPPADTFRRGDPNDSGATDLSDAVFIFGFLFLGGPAPGCRESADTNNDGTVDISDGVALLNFLFGGGPAPAPPAGTCGRDGDAPGTPGDLGCEAHASCRR